MRHTLIKTGLAALALAGCGGEDMTEVRNPRHVPGSTMIPPLTQEQDILIGPNEWAPVSEPIHAPEFTGEQDGGVTEKYSQHQYHGDGGIDGRPCYGSVNSDESTCYLPKSKSVRLHQMFFANDHQYFVDYSHEQLNWLPLEQFNWVLEEFQRAVLEWNNTAGFTISTTSGTQQLYIGFSDPTIGGNSVGAGGTIAGLGDHVQNALPYTAPNGEREVRLRSLNTSRISLNAYKVVAAVWTCGPQSGFDYEGRVRRYAYAVATHEFLHAFGFDHYSAGIMSALISCDYADGTRDIYQDAEPFWFALGQFSPGGTGVQLLEHAPLTAERPNG
jgi:hypothetical protein